MKMKKSPESLVATFAAALPSNPEIERRTMFGYPCAFVHGNMFAGLYQDALIVRLGEAERTKLLAQEGARIFEPMPGRPMREYVEVPSAIIESKRELQSWIARALAFAGSLPPKAKKAAKAAKATKAAPAKPAARATKKKTAKKFER